jgi:hypothetical protein
MIIGHVRDRYLMAVFFFHAKKKSPRLLGGSQYYAYLCHRYDKLKSYTDMRQVLFMAVLAAGMLLAGCSKEEGNSMQFTINESSISLLAHDDYKITPSGAFTARSSNEDVATVNADGIIHGVSAGDADIIFTSVENPTIAQTCKVNVDWRYKYFDEPILDFTMSVEEVKQRETHPLLAENWWDAVGYPDASDPYIIHFEYGKDDCLMYACYTFPDKKRHGVAHINLKNQTGSLKKILQQLEERYGTPHDIPHTEWKVFSHPKNLYYVRCDHMNIDFSQKPFD